MVISKITSGLGNQLFQFAIAKSLAEINNTCLYFDLRYYNQDYATDTSRNFKLDHFNINYKILESSKTLVLLSKSTKLFPNRTFNPLFKLVREEHHHYDEKVLDAKAMFLYLNGFWQSEKYFYSTADTIRKELTFKENKYETFNHFKREILYSANPISIHIRRGDYVNHPEFSKTFGFVGLEYYTKAIEVMKDKFPDNRFFIFSDDQEWVKNNFPLREQDVFVKNTGEHTDVDDLQLMSVCKHHIIANSSYSWWGAWLNNSKTKTVIAPQTWYKNQPTLNTKDLVPSSWLKI